MYGTSYQNYKDFKVLLVKSDYKKVAINWVVKNKNIWYDSDTYKSKRRHRGIELMTLK